MLDSRMNSADLGGLTQGAGHELLMNAKAGLAIAVYARTKAPKTLEVR
jgi:hypothetical protein